MHEPIHPYEGAQLYECETHIRNVCRTLKDIISAEEDERAKVISGEVEADNPAGIAVSFTEKIVSLGHAIDSLNDANAIINQFRKIADCSSCDDMFDDEADQPANFDDVPAPDDPEDSDVKPDIAVDDDGFPY